MQIRHIEIPRVGQKYTLTTQKGNQAILIFHRNGQKEFYFTPEADDEPELGLELTDEEARIMGALLLGIDYRSEKDEVKEDSQQCFENILVEWIILSPKAELANQTIAEAEIRSRTGVTIIALERDGEMQGSPDINKKLIVGDRIMVTGTEEDIKKFEKICQGS